MHSLYGPTGAYFHLRRSPCQAAHGSSDLEFCLPLTFITATSARIMDGLSGAASAMAVVSLAVQLADSAYKI